MRTAVDHKRELHERGFTVVADMLTPAEIEHGRARLEELYHRVDPALDAPGMVIKDGGAAAQEERGSRETTRNFITNLVSKDPLFADLMVREPVLGLVRSVLGDDCILSSLNSLEPLKGHGHQDLHRDEGPVGPEGPTIVNTLWVFDDMDSMNGATRFVPGTQRDDALAEEDDPRLVYAEVPAGSVLVINAHMLHAASMNRDGRRRRIAHVFYTTSGRRTQTDWREFVPADVRARLSGEQLALLGLR